MAVVGHVDGKDRKTAESSPNASTIVGFSEECGTCSDNIICDMKSQETLPSSPANSSIQHTAAESACLFSLKSWWNAMVLHMRNNPCVSFLSWKTRSGRIFWMVIIIICICLTLVGLLAAVVSDAVLPILVQRELNNSRMDLKRIDLSSPTDTSVQMLIGGVVLRHRNVAATIESSNLQLYFIPSYDDTSSENMTQAALNATSNAVEPKVVESIEDVLIGSLSFDKIQLNGMISPLHMSSNLTIVNSDGFKKLMSDFIKRMGVSLRLSGEVTVLTLGRRLEKIIFYKTLSLNGDSEESRPTLTNGLRMVEYNVSKSETHPGLDLDVLMELNHKGLVSIDPVGAVTFDLLWQDIWIGNLTAMGLVLTPGLNLIKMTGILDPLQSVRGMPFFRMVKKMKSLASIRSELQAGLPVLVTVVGKGCSISLYDAAIKTIRASFPLKGISSGLLESLVTR